jgi:hypothetical protein
MEHAHKALSLVLPGKLKMLVARELGPFCPLSLC